MVMVGRIGWVVLRLPGVAGLNHEVPAVPIQSGAVNHVLAVGVEAIPLAIEPVFEITYEEVLVPHAEKPTVNAFTVLETSVDSV